ncbi:Acetylornithine/succinyldiaminopimelate/putrescine aminotransferase [Ekhidna lutea]|uniref:Acetylornithine/succinyldiaminopimelate/putrescine aminotransferase n=1 Tax=Ekhidna lutea TaxID=447679 RepID=A0A239M738_EKHLU|nr:aspartate aminotransferase family protein [Ekhidna lutea]SNT38441.1 Acetylornithine/succinyldiaminopimelate/putrescine aminotransferase [Ekhidna lutea]
MPTQRQLFLNHLAQTSDAPLLLEMVSAEGIYMTDVDGKKYIDLISGIGVSNVGHRHPNVIDAIKDQVDKHLHVMVYGEFVQSPQVKLAEALTNTLPDNLNSVYLVNSGSEAIEGAMKLAKRYTGRSKLIACNNAYHGSSHGALSLTGSESFKRNYRPLLPAISHIDFGSSEELNQITSEIAAVVIETVQGEAGVRQADNDYWKALRRKCDETDTLLILDEIQCGFGRTGRFWAFEHYGIKPDILVSAKGMGGGMPIGCFISDKEIMQVFTDNPVLGHISTFGGHPVSSAAALATLETILNEHLLDGVAEKEALFHSYLKHPLIKEVRSKGLMMAVEFESYDILKPIIDRAIELGVVTDWFLFNDKSMRIAPPLIITEDEIKKACNIIFQAIDDISK